jgi:hypothetical protein
MDKDTLLKSLAGSLDENIHTRKHAEQQLVIFEAQPGFTSYLLDLIIEPDVQRGIQISAALLFKNRIINHWLIAENKAPSATSIREDEKPLIKEKLIQTLLKTYKSKPLRFPLSTALHNILSVEKWDEMVSIIVKLLSDDSNVDQIYTGLICLYEYTKNYRWSGLESSGLESSGSSNPVLEDVCNEIFPRLEELTRGLTESDSELCDELLYLIIKIFKFTTYSSLPTYLQNPANLGNWCQFHIVIINKPLSRSILEDEADQRCLHPRIKTVKWCFGNLHRLISRHGGGFSTKEKSNQFTATFLENFVPEILNCYWKIIEEWSTKKIWLSEASLYHMISFLEQLIETPAWQFISDKMEAILRHVILPTLNATEETIELYEDEPEEYIRRFFDINRESNTSDIASINFIYRLTSKKLKSCINLIINIINEIFNKRAADTSDIHAAMETEGALRVLSTISFKLNHKDSPVFGQTDKVLHTFVYPELSPENSAKTPWLTSRACDTLAMFRSKYNDPQVLQDIFQGIVQCFQNEAQFPIQLTAVDALCTLVEEDLVAVHVAEQAPQLMGTLLEMSKKFESDILTTVMETFVEKFAKNLEPYATELASKLVEQFLRLASDLLDQNNIDVEKEYQCSGILGTLTSLVIAMTSSPNVAASMETVLQGMVKFILENAMVTFLTEAIEILESILFSTRVVSPVMWDLFQACLDSFDTFAFEYFDSFQPFFESVINFGFTSNEVSYKTPYVQGLMTVCFNLLKSESLDPLFAHSTFEIIELTIIALKERVSPILDGMLVEIFDIFTLLESQDAFDGYMLHYLSILKVLFGSLYVDPVTTIQFLNSKQFVPGFFKLWMKYSEDFQSVYGCKLQALALTSLITSDGLNLIPEDLISESVDLLLSSIAALPNAIKAKNDILSKEKSLKTQVEEEEEDDDEYGGAYYEDELEADEAELEALKQTPIDEINVFLVFTNSILMLQQQNPTKYQILFGGIEQGQQELIEQLVKITQEQK